MTSMMHMKKTNIIEFLVLAEYKGCPYIVNSWSLTAWDTYYYVGRAPVCSKDAVPPLGVH